ncbi:hypothetical protein KP509_23G013000 [Ceratopteris richardii]|uniref:Protein FAM33A n=1 Tax=Ceratopteris richardii TaxID=49495 RepID=A0A8T2RZ42_CERRI|nr:hypothetical protein KP509_23G013000 [Ceratopteris richardii]
MTFRPLLQFVQQKLEAEFKGSQAGQVDPFKLQQRIERIQHELPLVEDECRKLIAAKQVLIDKTKKTLVANRATISQLQEHVGVTLCSNEYDVAYSSFMKVLTEWNDRQLQSDDRDYYPADEDFQKLLSSIV